MPGPPSAQNAPPQALGESTSYMPEGKWRYASAICMGYPYPLMRHIDFVIRPHALRPFLILLSVALRMVYDTPSCLNSERYDPALVEQKADGPLDSCHNHNM